MTSTLKELRILVTAGPTREPIDPVRFISNRSSGKMGYAIAAQAVMSGAKVTLVSGPVSIKPPNGARLVKVETAGEMYKEVISRFSDSDIVIKAAAVSDYRPRDIVRKKIKKKTKQLNLPLVANPDILEEIGKRKRPGQIIVGFALETEDLIANAKKKLKTKNCDMIVANDVSVPGAGFELDTNIVSIIYPDGHVESLAKMKKDEIARQILRRVVRLIRSQ